MAGWQGVTVTRLTLNLEDFDWHYYAMTDFFVCCSSQLDLQPLVFRIPLPPFLKICFQEVPLEEIRTYEQQVVVSWFSGCWMQYPCEHCRFCILSVSSYRREICLYVGLSKALLTCNFQISLRQHLRSGLRTGKMKICSCFWSSVEIWSFTSLQQLVPSRSRKLTAYWLLAYQLAAELKGNLTAQQGFYKIFIVFLGCYQEEIYV